MLLSSPKRCEYLMAPENGCHVPDELSPSPWLIQLAGYTRPPNSPLAHRRGQANTSAWAITPASRSALRIRPPREPADTARGPPPPAEAFATFKPRGLLGDSSVSSTIRQPMPSSRVFT